MPNGCNTSWISASTICWWMNSRTPIRPSGACCCRCCKRWWPATRNAVAASFSSVTKNSRFTAFRGATPRFFQPARHWLQQHAQAQTLTQHLSWRSSPAIIRFVNLVFHRPSDTDAETDCDYPLQDFQKHDTHHQQLWGRAELLPLIRRQDLPRGNADQAWRNPLEQPRQTDEDTRHRQEGDLIAGKIRQLLGTPVADKDRVRPMTGDDIMILQRDRTHARLYEEALRRA